MDLSQIGNLYIFQLPIDTSMLATIRQQLWATIDRFPDITNLMTAHLIQCKRIDRQPCTYLSALPHQLLQGNTQSTPYLSPQILGNYLLEHLAANNHDELTTQWQGTTNDQGYIYLQPSDSTITAGLNQLLNNKNSEINSHSPATQTASSLTLQYIYTRCHQILQPFKAEILQLNTTEISAQTTNEMKLIGAIVDIWDHIFADESLTNISNRRILVLSQQLVEQFLEFEKACCLSAKSNKLSRNCQFSLIAVVQTTVKTILQQYWGLEPLQHW